jgi:acetaldehyde dehydrogenase/alcohol dehydrogenase
MKIMMEAAYYGLTWDEVKNRKADVASVDASAPAKTTKKAQK